MRAAENLGRFSDPNNDVDLVYTYDGDGQLATLSTTFPVELGQEATVTASYEYDQAGRVTSWGNDGIPTETYGWDENGNRTSLNNIPTIFDERNRQTAGPEGAYLWSPRGTLQAAGTTLYTHDALGRTATVGLAENTYDSLDRLQSTSTFEPGSLYAFNNEFGYNGTTNQIMSTGGQFRAKYDYDPNGQLLSADYDNFTGLNSAAWTGLNSHGDLTWLANYDGTLHGARTYSPFGTPVAQTGGQWPNLGFQSDWTDPATGNVWMAARWYRPTTGTFTSRDTIPGNHLNPISTNRYLYGHANPLRYSDPTGRSVCMDEMCGWTITRNAHGQYDRDTALTHARAAGVISGYYENYVLGNRPQVDTGSFFTGLRNGFLAELDEVAEFLNGPAEISDSWLDFAKAVCGSTDHDRRQCNDGAQTAAIITTVTEIYGGVRAAPTIIKLAKAAKNAPGLIRAAVSLGRSGDVFFSDIRFLDDVTHAGDLLPVSDRMPFVAPEAILTTPQVSSTRLQNIVNNLYRGTTNPGRVGTGTTMDAVRFELANPGAQVFGRSHIIKAQESLRGLENWLKANPAAPYSERLVARSLADDLLDALGRSQ